MSEFGLECESQNSGNCLKTYIPVIEIRLGKLADTNLILYNIIHFLLDDISLRVRAFFHKTVRVCHVYCNFKIGFTCWITVIFGTLKDGSLLINTLASNICFTYRNMFQNGVDTLSKIVDAFFVKKLKISSSLDYPIKFKFC